MFATTSEHFLGLGQYILAETNMPARAGTISFPLTSRYFKNPHCTEVSSQARTRMNIRDRATANPMSCIHYPTVM